MTKTFCDICKINETVRPDQQKPFNSKGHTLRIAVHIDEVFREPRSADNPQPLDTDVIYRSADICMDCFLIALHGAFKQPEVQHEHPHPKSLRR